MHFYINNAHVKTKIKSTISLTIDPKTKPLGINLIKHEQDLYTENCKMLMKEISEDLNKGIDTPCSWIRRFNIGKMSIFSPKGSTDKRITIKVTSRVFVFFSFLIDIENPFYPWYRKIPHASGQLSLSTTTTETSTR